MGSQILWQIGCGISNCSPSLLLANMYLLQHVVRRHHDLGFIIFGHENIKCVTDVLVHRPSVEFLHLNNLCGFYFRSITQVNTGGRFAHNCRNSSKVKARRNFDATNVAASYTK